jgi:hypothetical protein
MNRENCLKCGAVLPNALSGAARTHCPICRAPLEGVNLVDLPAEPLPLEKRETPSATTSPPLAKVAGRAAVPVGTRFSAKSALEPESNAIRWAGLGCMAVLACSIIVVIVTVYWLFTHTLFPTARVRPAEYSLGLTIAYAFFGILLPLLLIFGAFAYMFGSSYYADWIDRQATGKRRR